MFSALFGSSASSSPESGGDAHVAKNLEARLASLRAIPSDKVAALRAALEASVLRLPRAFADFAAARRELHAFALARASGALDAAEARRILEGASTGARLDDARERFSRVYVSY